MPLLSVCCLLGVKYATTCNLRLKVDHSEGPVETLMNRVDLIQRGMNTHLGSFRLRLPSKVGELPNQWMRTAEISVLSIGCQIFIYTHIHILCGFLCACVQAKSRTR